MGFLDDTKDNLNDVGENIKKGFENAKDKVDDWADEKSAELKVDKAQTELDATRAKNKVKDEFRT